MFPKKRRTTFVPIMVESKPPSITDYDRAQRYIRNAVALWNSGRDILEKKR